ncbi:MAG: hypothetical protein IPN69_24830 [Acidobacteria bacterium]|nr:hypothetical protein [Acidobacteriota bacterium]MBK8147524.1 hypothetical protein [Acidobacteriota bacterium]MBK8813937.1 hypothetical protein [Acidobacteriota bacterium]
MNGSLLSTSQLSLKPLGAGDLIDRAIRLYRKNFWTFLWIAAPPILAGTLISVVWTVIGRSLFTLDSVNNPGETFIYYVFLWLGNLFIWMIEIIAAMTVMGGAARVFVRHLLFEEPITFRETYKTVKGRIPGLIAASTIITVVLGMFGLFLFYVALILVFLAIAVTFAAFSFSPFLTTIVSIALSIVLIGLTLWVFFLLASRFAYVPQVMLVEGQPLMSAIGRSASLASGNVKRLAGLVIFTLLAIYSALALLYVPLGWYAWVNGVEILRFAVDPDAVPAWYEIANQFIWQASMILLLPVWMIGLCLLYVDERVRHEGYDIELMAARRLGEIPAVPEDFVNPLQPALAHGIVTNPEYTPERKSSFTTLGLK